MNPQSKLFQRWDGRLQNWALWMLRGTMYGLGGSCDGERGEGAPRPPTPLVGEALDTDDLVLRLKPERLIAVRAVYVWTGTLAERAAYLKLEPKALDERVDQAMYDLEAMDQKRHIKTGIPERKSNTLTISECYAV